MAMFTTTVAAPAAYNASADVTIPFVPKRVTIINEDTTAANQVMFSYDGVNDAGAVKPTVNPTYESRQLAVQLWFKRTAGTPTVRVIAEA